MKKEEVILTNLIKNENFMRKSLPYLKAEYFLEGYEKKIVNEIRKYVEKYNTLPTTTAIKLSLEDSHNISESELNNSLELLGRIDTTEQEQKLDWLLDIAEKFCQEKAIHNAIYESIEILDDEHGTRSKGIIPSILTDALSISFDPSIGHDYITNSDDRYDFYHKLEKRIPFDIELFNKITGGGLPPKSLIIALGGTGAGKSLFMCHVAASILLQNYNVLYITLEMSEERIAERIDANILDVTMDELRKMPKDVYKRRMSRLAESIKGRLIIKEYPTASANAAHFRALLNDLAMKKNFKPSIIFVDYLNICSSSRIKTGSNINSYTYIKAIAEELRGLAVEFDVPVMSATQTTRAGFNSQDPGLEDTSESFGLPATADLMFALVAPEELQNLNQMMIKQLKNRYNDPNYYRKFMVGVDRSKMKLYNITENQPQQLPVVATEPRESKPAFERNNNSFGNKFNKLKVD